MLQAKKLIPPLTLRVSQSRLVRAWDFKQHRNLVIAFLDSNCARCESFFRTLVAHAADLATREAVALLLFPESADAWTPVVLPPGVIAGVDVGGEAARRFLGQNLVSVHGPLRRGIFVTDRYGELSDEWLIEAHDFPPIERILGALDQIEIACEECGDAHWLRDL